MNNQLDNNSKKLKRGKRILIINIVIFFSLLGFVGGYFLGKWDNYKSSTGVSIKKEIVNKSTSQDVGQDIDFNLFWEVWNNVKNNHIEQPVDETDMFYGALTGIVASLQDPYSIFLDPELTQSFEEDINGTFEGIGAEIGIKDNRITIIAPLPGMPADKAGLKAGDIVLAIDGLDTTNINLDYAIKLIRGEKGSLVTLTIQREEEVKEIDVVRDMIKIDSVTWEIKESNGKKVGYIQITNFNTDTSNKLNEAIQELILENPYGIVLDLRNNAGGLLDQSIEVSSRFIENGVIAYEEYKDGSREEYKSKGNAQLARINTVVLVNKGSASASEIVAGALQDYNVAVIVGEKTFGKGSVQSLQKFQDGSSLKLTVGKWYTPNGRSINDNGIDPDEVVELTEEDYNNDLDPQLDRALEILVK